MSAATDLSNIGINRNRCHAGPGELFTIDTESPQRAYNSHDAEENVIALAVGAPAIDDDIVAYDPNTED
ncbi:hypothetical protein [Haloquadratum walsbyi]|uniref:hypothetical protein n=1 Tax=Haloquadratum walsbyi TaxID=293091 RepID=UPI000ACC47BB